MSASPLRERNEMKVRSGRSSGWVVENRPREREHPDYDPVCHGCCSRENSPEMEEVGPSVLQRRDTLTAGCARRRFVITTSRSITKNTMSRRGSLADCAHQLTAMTSNGICALLVIAGKRSRETGTSVRKTMLIAAQCVAASVFPFEIMVL
mmetsp:Transcript_37310/g.81217  ORF Transcript_37310/g.81217 Transcript_37310/m.81217 type:complete len:151 (+) Transcript_37310:150-602(+)